MNKIDLLHNQIKTNASMKDKAEAMLKAMPSRKVLFLHGLESIVPSEKTRWLDKTFELFAPKIDYNKPNIYKEVLALTKEYNPSVIIGSSMGGYFGFYIAGYLQKSAILFNPALPYRTSVKPQIDNMQNYPKQLHLILGKADKTINPNDTLKWISEHKNKIEDITIRILDFEHRIPIEIFKNEIDNYYKQF